MSKTIEIIIRAKDQASKTLNAFGKEVNTGKIALKAFNQTAGKGKQAVGILSRELRTLATAFLSYQGAVKAATTIGDFEQGLAKVSTLSEASAESLSKFKDELIAISKRVPQSAAELVAAEYDLVSAGVKLENSAKILELAAKAAVAGVTDTKTAVKVGLSLMNAYGLGLDDLQMIFDSLFQTVKDGMTTMPELAEHFGKLSPIARPAGVDIQDLAAALSVLTKSGMSTDIAVTALRGAISALSSPGEAARAEMDRLGISWTTLEDTIRQIADQNLGPAALRMLVPDINARAGVNSLVLSYSGLKEELGKVKESAGATERAFQKMVGTLQNRFKIVRNAISAAVLQSEGFKESLDNLVSVAQDLAPQIGELVSGLVTIVGNLISWTLENKNLIATFIGGAGLLAVIGKIVTLVSAGSAAFAVLKATQIGTWLSTVAGAGNLAAGGLSLVGIALKGVLIVAAINAVIEVGKLVKAFFDLRAESEKLAAIKKDQAVLDEKVAKQLEKINRQTGLNVKSVKEYIALQKAGVIVRNRETGALEVNKEALEKYRINQESANTATKAGVDALAAKAAADKAAADKVKENEVALNAYNLKLADLKIALAKDQISQDEYNQQTLAATQAHWVKMVETRQAAVDTMRNVGKSGTDEYAEAVLALREAELKLVEVETAVQQAVDNTGQAHDQNKQRLKDALDGWQAVADEGVANYALALTELDIALANGQITEARYHEESLQAEKEHWVKMVAAKAAAVATMAAAGLRGTLEYKDALLELRDAEYNLIDTENRLREEISNTSDVMNVSESAWASFAKKVGLTVEELKNVVTPAAKAAEAGRQAANVSESAWEAFAKKVNLTTEELKNAVNGIIGTLDEAGDLLDDFNDKWSGTFTYVGAVDFSGNLSDALNMSAAELDAAKKKWTYLGSKNTHDQGGWWDDAKQNWAKMGGLLTDLQTYMAKPALGLSGRLKDNLSPQDLASLQNQFGVNSESTQNNTTAIEQNTAALNGLNGLKPALGLNSGGSVPGSGSGDTVPAMLTPGEFVIRKGVVNSLGLGFFRALNSGLGLKMPQLNIPRFTMPSVQHFATGGSVQPVKPVETINVNLSLNGVSARGNFPQDSATMALIDELDALSMVSG